LQGEGAFPSLLLVMFPTQPPTTGKEIGSNRKTNQQEEKMKGKSILFKKHSLKKHSTTIQHFILPKNKDQNPIIHIPAWHVLNVLPMLASLRGAFLEILPCLIHVLVARPGIGRYPIILHDIARSSRYIHYEAYSRLACFQLFFSIASILVERCMFL